jgi:hypothetical protein
VDVRAATAIDVPGGQAVAVVAGRGCIAQGNKLLMSPGPDPDTGASRVLIGPYGGVNVHAFPSTIVALAGLEDRLFVFTKQGIYAVDGLAYDIVDAYGNPQQRVSKISGDVVARSAAGFAYWRNDLAFVANDGVYVLNPTGQLELVSQAIGPMLRSLFDAGQNPGQAATYRDHLFLPMGTSMLVGRLDKRVKTPVGTSAPWTRFVGGDAPSVRALAVADPYGTSKLIAGTSTSGKVLELSGVFTRSLSTAAATDASGAAFSGVVETAEYTLAGGALATVRDAVVDYKLGHGTGTAEVAVDGGGYASLASSLAVNSTTGKQRVLAVRRSGRRLALRLTLAGSAGSALRSLRLRGRLRGRGR